MVYSDLWASTLALDSPAGEVLIQDLGRDGGNGRAALAGQQPQPIVELIGQADLATPRRLGLDGWTLPPGRRPSGAGLGGDLSPALFRVLDGGRLIDRFGWGGGLGLRPRGRSQQSRRQRCQPRLALAFGHGRRSPRPAPDRLWPRDSEARSLARFETVR